MLRMRSVSSILMPTSQASQCVARGWEYHSTKPYVSMHLQSRKGRKESEGMEDGKDIKQNKEIKE